MGNQLSLVTDNACIAPAWEEIGSYTTPVNRRVSQSDYVPQHIMSPADMLKLEEQLADESAFREEDKQEQEQERPQEQERKPKLELEPGDFGLSFAPGGRQKPARSRTNSILSNMSAATSAFGIAEKHVAEDRSIRNAHTPSGTPPRRPVTANDLIRAGVAIDTRQPLRSTSVLSRGSKSPTITARSSTTQLKLSPPSSPTTYGPPSLEHSAGGLPPPPRRRRAREEKEKEKEKEVDRDPSNKRISIAPFHPLSPPPRRKTTGTSMVHEEFGQEQQQLSPLSSRPPSAFDPQKINKRRSIMRKPSFLEIEDDADHETESLYDVQVDIQSLEMESSFLDLDRGKDSFDTVRSCDDDFINRF
ncbi:hypothetical protein EW026_g1905 [Hermanssonia centrifuga]|uniref:Uncharacterized protein n=1 Tax=Hermanssonia centrifuga TaxID=98765 RepID=A0A4S4KQL6_9APHY|nr:hypothetical protein EW026_g1905 [Hermanssonia centrifuga]